MTTTDDTNTRQALEVRALRMLRAGDSPKDITQATGLTRDEITRLARDFPGPTRPAPPAPATVTTLPPSAPLPPPPPAPLTVVPAEPGPEPTTPAAEPPVTIARLLEHASAHSNTRIRRLGEQIETQLATLRDRIAEQAQAEQAKQAELAAKAAARAEVKRLEEQLAAAKAALRGKPTTTPQASKSRSSSWTPERRAAQAERIRAANAKKAAAQHPEQAQQ